MQTQTKDIWNRISRNMQCCFFHHIRNLLRNTTNRFSICSIGRIRRFSTWCRILSCKYRWLVVRVRCLMAFKLSLVTDSIMLQSRLLKCWRKQDWQQRADDTNKQHILLYINKQLLVDLFVLLLNLAASSLFFFVFKIVAQIRRARLFHQLLRSISWPPQRPIFIIIVTCFKNQHMKSNQIPPLARHP